jgi:hypothetical protein
MDSSDSESVAGQQSHLDEQLFMVLSKEAMSPSVTSKTLKLLGNIQGREVVLLFDSGCSHSFI